MQLSDRRMRHTEDGRTHDGFPIAVARASIASIVDLPAVNPDCCGLSSKSGFIRPSNTCAKILPGTESSKIGR